MKIHAGSDHAGVALRGVILDRLRRQGHEVVDHGTNSNGSVDYPDYAARVARAVRGDAGSLGVLVCGSGFGVAVAANKIRGIRAVAPWDVATARLAREHNDANVLCVGARLLPEDEAVAMTETFLTTPFEGGRHVRRLEKIGALEATEALAAAVDAEARALDARRTIERIWQGEPSAFTADPGHAKSIRNRLGWLRAPEQMVSRLGEITAFAQQVRGEGLRQVVLLGMGGSSLCPEVLATTFGVPAGGLPLHVLDNTDPAAVMAVERAIDLDTTLFVVASKSGGTIEVRSFERHFWARVLERHGGDPARAGAHFVAVTDPNTELEARAKENRYRQTFLNAADVGGRYSALTNFGLVPAALLGLDASRLLGSGRLMAKACEEPVVADNPGAQLGAFLGACARQGRDKMTLLLSPELASFGSWIEQLVAESTGKLGKGILPVDLEPLGPAEAYGTDRSFVAISLRAGTPPASAERLEALRSAGHPLLELELGDRYDLGGEFFRWELATAVAGASLAVNPFDEPNVTEAKEATGRLLEAFAKDGKLPAPARAVSPTDGDAILRHLATAGAGDYVALCAFFLRTDERDRRLTELRALCRDRLRVATTLGYGPRFLHSTGQLHKGGPATGVFLQLTADVPADLPVPDQPFTFGVLRDAQALGDLQVLERRGLRALRVHLGADVEGSLDRLTRELGARLGR